MWEPIHRRMGARRDLARCRGIADESAPTRGKKNAAELLSGVSVGNQTGPGLGGLSFDVGNPL